MFVDPFKEFNIKQYLFLYIEKNTHFINKISEIFEFSFCFRKYHMTSSVLGCSVLRQTNFLNSLICTGRQTLVFIFVLLCIVTLAKLINLHVVYLLN